MITAISSSMDNRLSPNAGALTATTFKLACSLFTSSNWRACASISSAMMRSGAPFLDTCSSTGINSAEALSLLSVTRM